MGELPSKIWAVTGFELVAPEGSSLKRSAWPLSSFTKKVGVDHLLSEASLGHCTEWMGGDIAKCGFLDTDRMAIDFYSLLLTPALSFGPTCLNSQCPYPSPLTAAQYQLSYCRAASSMLLSCLVPPDLSCDVHPAACVHQLS